MYMHADKEVLSYWPAYVHELVQGGSRFTFIAPPIKYMCGVEMSSIEVSQQDA